MKMQNLGVNYYFIYSVMVWSNDNDNVNTVDKYSAVKPARQSCFR